MTIYASKVVRIRVIDEPGNSFATDNKGPFDQMLPERPTWRQCAFDSNTVQAESASGCVATVLRCPDGTYAWNTLAPNGFVLGYDLRLSDGDEAKRAAWEIAASFMGGSR